MLIRPYKVSDVRDYFIGAKQGGGYGQTIDKTGVKCIELIGASFHADEEAIFGSLNYVSEIFLNYQSSIFDFVLILAIITSVGIFAYLLINYLVDRRSRELINSIITELKHISK